MQTVVDINNIFQEIVTKHIQLKQFYTFSLDEIDIDKITIDLFPLLYAQCTNASIDGGVTIFTYEVIVADFETPLSCEPFTARFSNMLTGWSTSFEISVPNAIDLCIAPYTT